jgi:DEAD/DEAH box helicase domain-containing protein
VNATDRRVLYVSCSATITSPAQHMKNVFGIDDVVEVTDDGAPAGRKDFLLWCPPWIDAQDPSLGRKNSMAEATCLMRYLMKRGVRAILFCKVSAPLRSR